MKKIVSIVTAFLLVVTIVGCSSKSKKYDDEINKVLQKAELKREDINITVYNVTFNLGRDDYDGDKNIYKITYLDNKYNDNETVLYTILNTGDVKKLEKDAIVMPLLQKQNIVYEEANNKNLKEQF